MTLSLILNPRENRFKCSAIKVDWALVFSLFMVLMADQSLTSDYMSRSIFPNLILPICVSIYNIGITIIQAFWNDTPRNILSEKGCCVDIKQIKTIFLMFKAFCMLRELRE